MWPPNPSLQVNEIHANEALWNHLGCFFNIHMHDITFVKKNNVGPQKFTINSSSLWFDFLYQLFGQMCL
jgi:hypothetical protein